MTDLLWTEPEDVRSRWLGDKPFPAETSQVETLLADAEDTILGEFPDLPARLKADEIPLRRVKKVAARVVIRHLRNPTGVRQTQDGAGPFQRSTTYGGEEPGTLYLTDEDRAELAGSLGVGAAFTIDQTPDLTDLPRSPEGWLAWGRTWVP